MAASSSHTQHANEQEAERAAFRARARVACVGHVHVECEALQPRLLTTVAPPACLRRVWHVFSHCDTPYLRWLAPLRAAAALDRHCACREIQKEKTSRQIGTCNATIAYCSGDVMITG